MTYLADRDDKIELFIHIKSLLNDGTIRTKDVAKYIQKSERQTRRYFLQMSQMGMISLTGTARIATTTESVAKYKISTISGNEFAQNPHIRKWLNGCLVRNLSPNTIKMYLFSLKQIFGMKNTNPADVISSRESAIDFWVDFIADYKRSHPERQTHHLRVSYKNFHAAYGITFTNNVGKIYGLSSTQDKIAAYAGVHFTNTVTQKIGKLMLDDGDFALYVWFRIALRTGARASAISTMTWDRIYQTEDGHHVIEQHETKDKRGHVHLGSDGEWKAKYVPNEIHFLLSQWKQICPDKRFLWIRDGNSDMQNRRFATQVRAVMSKKLRQYYERISSMVDPQTREFMLKRPHHILRHTLVQQMKNSGLSNDEIAECFGWKSPEIVGIWYSKTSEKRKREIAKMTENIPF